MLKITMLTIVGLISLSHAGKAAEGNCAGVGGIPAPTKQFCLEVQTGTSPPHIQPVPHGSVHVNSPECGDAAGAANALNARLHAKEAEGAAAGGFAGAFVGGPYGAALGTAAGGAIAKALDGIERSNSPGRSNCRLFCVVLPPDAKNIDAYGWMTLAPWRGPVAARCELGNPNCNASFGSFTALERRPDPQGGTVMCTVGKNWSDTDQRQAGFRVEFDR